MPTNPANQNLSPPPVRDRVRRPVPLIPDDIAALLGRRPLIYGEKPEDYDRLFARFVTEVKPNNYIEWQLVRDAMNCQWESRRYRVAKACLINEGIASAARPLVALAMANGVGPAAFAFNEDAEILMRLAQGGDANAQQHLNDILKQGGHDPEVLTALAIAEEIATIDYLDRRIESFDRRRDMLLLDIERRHLALGQRQREAAMQGVTDIDPRMVA